MLAPERDPSRPPLVQVVFQLQNAPPPRGLTLPGLDARAARRRDRDGRSSTSSLNLFEAGEGARRRLPLQHRPLRRDDRRAPRRAPRALLEARPRPTPRRAVADLPLLSAAERHAAGRRVGRAPGRRTRSAAAASTRALRGAGAGDARGAGGHLRGREPRLRRARRARASRLADHLAVARGGAGRRSSASASSARSTSSVAILGVLAAGGAYVPLDPAYPAERLAFARRRQRRRGARHPRRPRPSAAGRAPPARRAGRRAAPLACGSTPSGRTRGRSPRRAPRRRRSRSRRATSPTSSTPRARPAGRRASLVTHGNVVRLFAARPRPGSASGPRDVWTLFHSYAFDFSVWEIWGALAYGGRLVVVPYWVSRARRRRFRELLARERVTVAQPDAVGLPPARRGPTARRAARRPRRSPSARGDLRRRGARAGVARALVRAPRRRAPAPRQHVRHHRDDGARHLPADRRRRRPRRTSASPIGEPIARPRRSACSTATLAPVPVGRAGRALRRRRRAWRGATSAGPELTAERFVPDPFAGAGGRGRGSTARATSARWLPTGDLGLPRADRPPGQDPRLPHRAGGDRGGARARTRRCGRRWCWRAAGEERRDAASSPTSTVRGGARPRGAGADAAEPSSPRRLPEHMVPAAFVTLAALPLTAQRQGRPAGARRDRAGGCRRRGRAGAYVAPRDDLERFLAGSSRESLEVERVGVHDGFFELGGNSIAGAVLVNRLQQELGEIVQVVVIFDAPTVAELADHLRGEHPRAVSRRWGRAGGRGADRGRVAPRATRSRVTEASAAELVAIVRARRPPGLDAAPTGPRNPRAVFVLAPPRSGTTLLRVMLGGHPRLFAPPELELPVVRDAGRASGGVHAAGAATLLARGGGAGGDGGAGLRGRGGGGDRRPRASGRGWTDAAALWPSSRRRWAGGCWSTRRRPTPSTRRSWRAPRRGSTAPLYVHLVRHPCGDDPLVRGGEARPDLLPPAAPVRAPRAGRADLARVRTQRPRLPRRACPQSAGTGCASRTWCARPEEVLRRRRRVPRPRPTTRRWRSPTRAGGADDRRPPRRLAHAGRRQVPGAREESTPGSPSAGARGSPRTSLGEPTRRLAEELGYAIGRGRARYRRRSGSGGRAGRGRRPRARRAPIRPAPRDGPCRSPSPRSGSGSSTGWSRGAPIYNIPLAAPPARRARPRRPSPRASPRSSRRHEVAPHHLRRGRRPAGAGRRAGRRRPARRRAARRPLRPARRRAARRRRGGSPASEAARPFDLARGPLVRAALVAPRRRATTWRSSPCTTSSPTAGRWASSCASWGRSTPRSRRPARPSPLRRARRSSTPTSPSGSAAGSPARSLERQLGLLAPERSPAPRRSSSCRPTGRARRCRRCRGAQAPFALPAALCRALRAPSARREGATLFMALLAAFAALLARLTGEDDVVVGSPVAGRNRARDRGADRLLRQHPGPAHRPRGRPRLRGARWRGCARRRSAPTPTRTCRSSAWSRSCSRSASLARHAALPGPASRSRTRRVGAPRAPRPHPRAARRRRGGGARPSSTSRLYVSRGGPAGRSPAAGSTTSTSSTRATIARFGGWLAALLDGLAAARRRALSELPLLSAAERSQLARWATAARDAAPPAGRSAAPTGSSRGRRSGPATRRSSGARSGSPTASWRPGSPASPAGSPRWASGRRRSSGSACRARRTSSWPSSRCSRPAAPTCRSIPAYPAERLGFMLEDTGRPSS